MPLLGYCYFSSSAINFTQPAGWEGVRARQSDWGLGTKETSSFSGNVLTVMENYCPAVKYKQCVLSRSKSRGKIKLDLS